MMAPASCPTELEAELDAIVGAGAPRRPPVRRRRPPPLDGRRARRLRAEGLRATATTSSSASTRCRPRSPGATRPARPRSTRCSSSSRPTNSCSRQSRSLAPREGGPRASLARPGRVHPRPAPRRAPLAAQALRAGRDLEPLPQPDRAGPAEAVGRDPPADRPGPGDLLRDALRAGRASSRSGTAPTSSPRSAAIPTSPRSRRRPSSASTRRSATRTRRRPARVRKNWSTPSVDTPAVPIMRRLAVLSLHTSPLAQPGQGDSGGMNVYVRELVSVAGPGRRGGRRLHPPLGRRQPRGGRGRARLPGRPRRGRARPTSPRSSCPTSSTRSPTACATTCARSATSMRSTPTTGCRGWPGTASSTSSTCRSCPPSTPWPA